MIFFRISMFFWNDLVKKRNIREKFEDYIRKEEDKLNEILNNIVMGLSNLNEFLKIKHELIDSIETNRKNYNEFMNNYFPDIDFW